MNLGPDIFARLSALCQRRWFPEQETEMIAAFADLVTSAEFVPEPPELSLIYHRNHEFFERHLFGCAAEYTGTDAECTQKLAILGRLGIGRHGAAVALAHWITGLSTQICSNILAQAAGHSAAAEEDFADKLAALASACEEAKVSAPQTAKIPALALLPQVSLSTGALLFICHCTDPAREPDQATRRVAVLSLGKLAGIAEFDQPMSVGWLAQLWRLSASGAGGEKNLQQGNAGIVLGALTKALSDPAENVFDGALDLARKVFLPQAWSNFVRYHSKTGIVRLGEALGTIIRAGGSRTDKVLAMLADPLLQHLHLQQSGPLAVFRTAIPAAELESPAFHGLCGCTTKLLHALYYHIQDPKSDFDESIGAISALVLICEHPSWSKFLCEMLGTYVDQGRSPSHIRDTDITYDELLAFEKAATPSFYQQFMVGTLSILANRSTTPVYSATAYREKFKQTLIITAVAKQKLTELLSNPLHGRQVTGAKNWATLKEIAVKGITLETIVQEFEASYKKCFRAGGAGLREYLGVMRSKSVPDRRMVKALLEAMKIISIGDVATQEFLIGIFGKDKATFHWHEPTRIWIVETLTAITRGEVMESGETVYEWLSVVEGRKQLGESDAVIAAAAAARKALRPTNVANPGTEMLLAPLAEQPDDAVGLPAQT